MSFAYLADAAACAVEAFLESWCSPVVPLPIVPVPEVPEVVQAHERLRELVQHPFFEGVEGERGSSGKLRSDGDGGIQSELCGGGDGRLEGELEGELERESEHHGLGQGKRSRPRSFSEKEDNRGGETKGDSASSQGIATVGLTESLLRNKSIKGVLSAEDDTAINQLLNGKWTVGCRVGGDLEAAGALAMAKAVRTLATSQSPSVIANILKAYLPVVVAGFAELPMDHQHGVVALLTPSEAEVEKIRKVAAGHEGGKVKGKFKWRLKHIFLAHDEGHSGTNKLIVYGWWEGEDGQVEGPQLLGSVETGKLGNENADAIFTVLDGLGLMANDPTGKPEVSVTAMGVDGAGAKVVAALEQRGLLFTIICDLHFLSLLAGCAKVCFGKETVGSAHPYRLAFDVVNLIRNHITTDLFFHLLACALNEDIDANGGNFELHVTPDEVQSKFGLVHRAMGSRWESVEKFADWLLCDSIILFKELKYSAVQKQASLPMTNHGVLVYALEVMYNKLRHKWYCRQSADTAVYGKTPHILVLGAKLRDPYSMAQLALLRDLYTLFFQPFYAFSRSMVNATQMLAVCELRLQEILNLDVEQFSTFQYYLKRLERSGGGGTGGSGAGGVGSASTASSKGSALKAGASATLGMMTRLQTDQLNRYRTILLPLALGDPLNGAAVAGAMRRKFEELGKLGEAGCVDEPQVVQREFEIANFRLKMSPTEVAAAALAMVEDTTPWIDAFTQREWILGFDQWYSNGCRIHLLHDRDEFRLLYSQVIMVAQNTTLAVEGGVNSQTRVDRSGDGMLSSSSSSNRQINYDAAQRSDRRAAAASAEYAHNRRGGLKSVKSRLGGDRLPGDRLLQTYVKAPKGKTAIKMQLDELEDSVDVDAFQAALGAVTSKRTESHTQKQRRITEKVAESSSVRNNRSKDNFKGKQDAATAEVQQGDVQPEAFNLVRLTKKYTVANMKRALIEARDRENPGGCDEYKATLQTLSAAEIRRRLVNRYFGMEWASEGFQLTTGAGGKIFPYAPRWGLSENEERDAVAAAKQRATTQLLNNGSAWAWLTATEKEVVEARTIVSNTL